MQYKLAMAAIIFLATVVNQSTAPAVDRQRPGRVGSRTPLTEPESTGKLFGVARQARSVLSALRDRPPGPLATLETRTPFGLAVSAAGTIYVADGRWPRLAAFSPNGKLLWQRNVRGLGPGELMFPYRVVLDKSENVVVLDLGSKTLLW